MRENLSEIIVHSLGSQTKQSSNIAVATTSTLKFLNAVQQSAWRCRCAALDGLLLHTVVPAMQQAVSTRYGSAEAVVVRPYNKCCGVNAAPQVHGSSFRWSSLWSTPAFEALFVFIAGLAELFEPAGSALESDRRTWTQMIDHHDNERLRLERNIGNRYVPRTSMP